MIESNRKFIDPTAVLKELTNQGIQFGRQQDVSEFHDLLLKKIESDYNNQNDVSKLFYGQIKTHLEYVEDSVKKSSETSTPFSNLILNVSNECHDVYSSLDVYTSEEKVEYKESATQSHWISSLPTVVMFQLQRIQFCKEKKTATKIQLPFTFEKEIYLNRYLNENRLDTLRLRKVQEDLQKEMTVKMEELHAVMNYQGRHISQIDVIRLTMAMTTSEEVKIYLEAKCNELEDKLNKLKIRIQEIGEALTNLYPRGSSYLLHSILVHEGDFIDSGHYYSFIWKEGQWLRSNDESVSIVSEEDVLKKSLKSAYCLIYYNSKETWKFDSYRSWIPHGLRDEVNNDNMMLLQRNKENEKQLTIHVPSPSDPLSKGEDTPHFPTPKIMFTDQEISKIPNAIDEEYNKLRDSRDLTDKLTFLHWCGETYDVRLGLFQKVIKETFPMVSKHQEEINRIAKKLGFVPGQKEHAIKLDKLHDDFVSMVKFIYEGFKYYDKNDFETALDFFRNAMIYHSRLPTRIKEEFDVPEVAYQCMTKAKLALVTRLKTRKCQFMDLERFYENLSFFFVRDKKYVSLLEDVCGMDEMEQFSDHLAMFTSIQEGSNSTMVPVQFHDPIEEKGMVDQTLMHFDQLKKKNVSY